MRIRPFARVQQLLEDEKVCLIGLRKKQEGELVLVNTCHITGTQSCK